MTVNAVLKESAKKLEQAGIGTARLDSLVLLEDVTGRDRAWLLANPEHEISSADHAKLTKLLNSRATHEPLAYVRTKTEFYGREFKITPAVLEPRPESETMIDLLLGLPKLPKSAKIADVGTGSGALGITAKLELPSAQIDLLEIDPNTLQVAKNNVDKYTIDISIIHSDLLSKANLGYDVLLCNLPYIPDDYQISSAALREPKLAIFGGPDGLDIYRQLFGQIKKLQKRPLFILTESLPPQHEALADIARQAGYEPYKTDDFIQVFQII